jgi:hypothetical protein
MHPLHTTPLGILQLRTVSDHRPTGGPGSGDLRYQPRHSLSEIRLWRKGRSGSKLGVLNLCSTWDFTCKVAAQEQNGTF